MDLNGAAVLVATVIAVALFVIYYVASGRERGRDPHYAREVYLHYDPAAPSPDPRAVAAFYNAAVATSSQVAAYAAAGGGAHGYGLVSEGGYLGLAPAAGGLAAAPFPAPVSPSAYGVWLYGAKPRRGTPHVEPFSCAHWFHPGD